LNGAAVYQLAPAWGWSWFLVMVIEKAGARLPQSHYWGYTPRSVDKTKEKNNA
jgi:hypothetical protein